MKNPLRFVLYVLVLYGILDVYSISNVLISTGLSYLLTTRLSMLIMLLLVVLFIFFYYKKSMGAFWAGVCVYPVITILSFLTEPDAKNDWLALLVINIVIFGYMCSRLEDYEKYLKKDTTARADAKNENSFRFLPLAAIGYSFFVVYKLYKVMEASEGFYGIIQTEMNSIMTLVFLLIFLFLFFRKNVLSWWLIGFIGPVNWFFYYMKHPFECKSFIVSFVVWCLVCIYLVYKYEEYRLYIRKSKNSEGRNRLAVNKDD